MPDRLFDLGQRVQDAVDPPAFDELHGRGRQLVRTRVIAVAFAVAVVAATGVTVATSGLVNSDPPVADVPLQDLTPEQVVQHPQAELESFAVDANDPDVRAAVWRVPCEAVSDDDTGRLCKQARQALAVSDDGFGSATYVDLPDNNEYPPRAQEFRVKAVGAGRFYVAEPYRDGSMVYVTRPYRNGSVVDTEGNVTPVAISKRPAPLGADEVFIEQELLLRRGVAKAFGLDVDAARAHVLQAEPATGWFGFGPEWQSPDGTLWDNDATPQGERVSASTDGGATWSRPHDLPILSGGGVTGWVPSAADRTIALVQADNISLVRSTDAGRTWDEVESPLVIMAHWFVIRPDGSLLMQADDGQIYASDGTDWTVATPVEPGLPDSVEWEYADETYAQSVVDADGNQTVYVLGDTDQTVWASTDGSHWDETPAR